MTSLSFYYNPLSSALFKFSLGYIIILPTTLFLLISKKIFIIQYHLFTINISYISFPILLDAPGTLTAFTVLFISSNVIKFAKLYIKSEQALPRFTNLVSLFVLSINLLIFFPSLPIILLGWDGLGITRFLLIIYYQNPKSLRAGIITALTNRIGDATILVAIALIFNSNQTTLFFFWDNKFFSAIRILLLLARLTKRAQIPFSSWLPAAIAAPTPVSALVHSSTLVTAGIFLQIRFSEFLFSFPKINFLVLFISASTILISGLSATLEYDVKKIIALSTLSQLRVIITSLALNFPIIALFHLVIHAIFKALIFICAGIFISIHSHNQDIRLIINLNFQLPITSSCFVIANISLCALPFLSGFYSKDLIIELLIASSINAISIIFILTALGATTAYSTRLITNCLWKSSNSTPLAKIFDSSPSIFQPTLILTFAAIIIGSTLNWLLLPQTYSIILPPILKFIAVFILLFRFSFCWILSSTLSTYSSPKIFLKFIFEISRSIWFLTPLSSQFFLNNFILSHSFLKLIDHGWLESSRAQGIHQTLTFYSKTFQPLQANIINIFIHISLILFIPIILLL